MLRILECTDLLKYLQIHRMNLKENYRRSLQNFRAKMKTFRVKHLEIKDLLSTNDRINKRLYVYLFYPLSSIYYILI